MTHLEKVRIVALPVTCLPYSVVDYVFFRQELTNLLYDIYASVIVIFKLIFTNDITKEMRQFPVCPTKVDIAMVFLTRSMINSYGNSP